MSAAWSSSPPPSATSRSNASATAGKTGRSRPERRGGVEDDVGVLGMERRAAARREVALEHAPAVDLEDAAGREPAGERIADDRRVDAGRAGQGEGLGDGGDGGTHDQLVACLGQLPGARATDPDDRATHRLEDGSCALDGGRVAADHDRQRAVGRADLAARHRRVEECAAARGAALGERRHRGRQVGAHRAHDQPVVGTGQDAGRSVEDRLEVRRVGDHDDEDVDQPGDLGRRGRRRSRRRRPARPRQRPTARRPSAGSRHRGCASPSAGP